MQPAAKRYWPADQEELLKTTFRAELAAQKCPNKTQCIEVLELFPHCGTEYRMIQYKVNNLITKAKGRINNRPVVRGNNISSESSSESE